MSDMGLQRYACLLLSSNKKGLIVTETSGIPQVSVSKSIHPSFTFIASKLSTNILENDYPHGYVGRWERREIEVWTADGIKDYIGSWHRKVRGTDYCSAWRKDRLF